jgi:hypothetical protein
MDEILQGEKFSLEHSYSDFRWFRPNRHLKLLVTTGRFQQVHYGHLLYLRQGLLWAIETNSRFRVITGPSDNEYRTQPDLKGMRQFFAPFRERRFLLSLLLNIPKSCIVKGRGRPSSIIKSEGELRLKAQLAAKHHEQTNHWVKSFFLPVGISEGDGVASRITLFVTAKEEDRIYHESHPEGPVHPIHLVSIHWNRTEQVVDYHPIPETDDSGTVIRSRNLDLNHTSICESVPAAACVATKLLQKNVRGSRFRWVVKRIHRQFRFGPYHPAELKW